MPVEAGEAGWITAPNHASSHVEASYWERDWRKTHRGFDIYPENYLWDATHGYLDLLEAGEHLRG